MSIKFIWFKFLDWRWILAWHNTLMKPKLPLQDTLIKALDELRLQTAKPDALVQHSVLGLITGLFTGLAIVAFIFLVDTTLQYWLPGKQAENFEDLPIAARIIAPVIGSILLALFFSWYAKGQNHVGVAYVKERLRYHEGYLKLRSFVLQFVGASIALISGHSMGREGPAIHLGAATGSQLGRSIGLPNNTIRTLVACGAAAAIGAAFNTPLAGVIFAMEIIIVEYTISSFIPIIISAVAATGIARWAFGSAPILSAASLPTVTMAEVPFLILLGLLVGFASTAFTFLIRQVSNFTREINLTTRFLIAGIATGLIAIAIPQVMGIGYDTVNEAILGQLSIGLLFAILIAKLVATAISVGCGLPAGLISPSLVIGAVGGSLMGIVLDQTLAMPVASSGLYTLIGMSAMMGACLQAPLAGLTAVFEITANHSVIWPSMLAIVIAQLVSRQLFKQPPVFDLLLQLRGLEVDEDPITQSLQRVGVAKIMSQDIICLEQEIEKDIATSYSDAIPQWIVIENDLTPIAVLRGIDLIKYLEEETEIEKIDLMKIPGKRLQISSIDLRATLAKAREIFHADHAEALCVVHWNRRDQRHAYGVIVRDQFEDLYT